MTDSFDAVAIARMLLILVHVLAVAAAGAAIAFGDYAIFARTEVDATLLRKAGSAVSVTLLVLWVTGLAVIWLDTRFDAFALLERPKLLAKLTIVTLLTANGIALHHIAFRRLCEPQDNAMRATTLPAALGAVSVVTWLHAAFLGLAKPVAPLLGYRGFILFYGVTVALGIAVAMIATRPRLAHRLRAAAAGGRHPDRADRRDGVGASLT